MALRRLLLLDFDGTITQHDTLASLVALAIDASSKRRTATTSTITTTATTTVKKEKQALRALWDEIVRDYVAAHRVHVEGYHPPQERRATLRQELAFLESTRDVERASVTRVGHAGFFAGLDAAALEELGREAVLLSAAEADFFSSPTKGGDLEKEKREGAVRVRKGFGDFLNRQRIEGWDLAVVSVNWSGEFIKGVVQAGCPDGQGGWVRRVVANQIEYPNGLVEGPKELGKEPLVTAGDKLRAMESLKEGLADEKVVYFGDSTTDLACLIEADLGVVMADDAESKLLNTLKRVGREVPHVAEARKDSKLVWARDFDEVLQSNVIATI
ncbi:haloacid dehalogenase-like hydrolase-domain-containing protein [Corynascus similis CBS 632.67]